ncbi:hypothetical protein GQ53DRAFT_643214 [Thozetella sp. PMI_491]|nr:hypothetical protein GQ53DRAFT_643214 [Thozetella sp. PMI_491]
MNKLVLLSALWQGIQGVMAAGSPVICDQTCKALASMGAEFEASQHADPNSTFYSVPSNFSQNMAPGTVLSVEYATNLANYQVPSPLTMSRIMYTTTDLNGTILPASAYILWPFMLPDADAGFPVVAWAHGTTGTFSTCAPSNYRALQYHFMVPFALAMQGVAVIAPDYAGLGVGSLPDGTIIPHAYSASPAQANDLANAILAARSAFPAEIQSNGSFVVAGHSQGGGVAWAFAERQAHQPVTGYRGTIAFAPAARDITWITQALSKFAANDTSGSTTVVLGIQNKVIAGVTAAYPHYNFSGLTDSAYDIWHNGIGAVKGCLPTDTFIQLGLMAPPQEFARSNWTADPTVEEFRNRTEVGGRKFAGPLLVLAEGAAGSPLNLDNLEAVVDETCQWLENTNSTEELEFVAYSSVAHFALIQASQPLWMGWIKDRLSGSKGCKKLPGPSCKKRTVEGFRSQFATVGIVPNWLVEGVPLRESWKYTL